MEKKARKEILKKFIAVICVFVVLQSYFSYFAQIAIATSETVIGEGEETSNSDEETIRRRRRKYKQ